MEHFGIMLDVDDTDAADTVASSVGGQMAASSMDGQGGGSGMDGREGGSGMDGREGSSNKASQPNLPLFKLSEKKYKRYRG